MATVFEVAKYITSQRGEMTAMKLQKLMYYSQAWHLVWGEEALFEEDFQAWANGPVLPSLYAFHRGKFKVAPLLFQGVQDGGLNNAQSALIDKVLSFYGDKTAQWLSDLTHSEDPWKNARAGLSDTEASSNVIEKASIHEYYSSL